MQVENKKMEIREITIFTSHFVSHYFIPHIFTGSMFKILFVFCLYKIEGYKFEDSLGVFNVKIYCDYFYCFSCSNMEPLNLLERNNTLKCSIKQWYEFQ